MVKRRVERAHVVVELHETVDVDDIFLTHLYETVVDAEDDGIVHITFHGQRSVVSRHHGFPLALFVIVSEKADVVERHHLELRFSSLYEQAVASGTPHVFHVEAFLLVVGLLLQTADDGLQFIVVDGFEEEVEGEVSEC